MLSFLYLKFSLIFLIKHIILIAICSCIYGFAVVNTAFCLSVQRCLYACVCERERELDKGTCSLPIPLDFLTFIPVTSKVTKPHIFISHEGDIISESWFSVISIAMISTSLHKKMATWMTLLCPQKNHHINKLITVWIRPMNYIPVRHWELTRDYFSWITRVLSFTNSFCSEHLYSPLGRPKFSAQL